MAAATIARAIVCELGQKQQQQLQSKKDLAMPTRGRLPEPPVEGGKIVLQPRLCTLRWYGVRDAGVMRRVERDTSPFFASLVEYVESSRKSQQFEIVSGRLAMVCAYSPQLNPKKSISPLFVSYLSIGLRTRRANEILDFGRLRLRRRCRWRW